MKKLLCLCLSVLLLLSFAACTGKKNNKTIAAANRHITIPTIDPATVEQTIGEIKHKAYIFRVTVADPNIEYEPFNITVDGETVSVQEKNHLDTSFIYQTTIETYPQNGEEIIRFMGNEHEVKYIESRTIYRFSDSRLEKLNPLKSVTVYNFGYPEPRMCICDQTGAIMQYEGDYKAKIDAINRTMTEEEGKQAIISWLISEYGNDFVDHLVFQSITTEQPDENNADYKTFHAQFSYKIHGVEFCRLYIAIGNDGVIQLVTSSQDRTIGNKMALYALHTAVITEERLNNAKKCVPEVLKAFNIQQTDITTLMAESIEVGENGEPIYYVRYRCNTSEGEITVVVRVNIV